MYPNWSINIDLTLISIDVPRPLINDLWAFVFQKIDAECVQ